MRLQQIAGIDFKIFCFLFACLIYAFLGSPTPNNFGIAELMIGVFLVLSVGGNGFRSILPKYQGNSLGLIGSLFLLYGLIMGSVMALLNGNDIGSIIRDIFPFVFLFLPIMMVIKPSQFSVVIGAALLVGIAFSVRSFLVRDDLWCWVWCTGELLYLENMPSVLFSALILLGMAFKFLFEKINIRNICISAGMIGLSFIPIYAMAVTQQRASLGAVAIMMTVLILLSFMRTPIKAVKATTVMLGCFILVTFFFDLDIFQIQQNLIGKTTVVGLNMRPQEISAVWQLMTQDLLTFIFGLGWGGHFHSPAVGGIYVNFTHNFFTNILLKIGFIGVLVALVYIGLILAKLSQVFRLDPVLGIALCAPILIDLTLYASFKSFDFGLMLLMAVASLVYLSNSSIESSKIEHSCEDPASFS